MNEPRRQRWMALAMVTLIWVLAYFCACEGENPHLVSRRWAICFSIIHTSRPRIPSTEITKVVKCLLWVRQERSYFIFSFYFKLIEDCLVGERCMFLHMCLSLCHKLWCKFGVSIDEVYGYIYGGPLHDMMKCWWWHLSVLVLFLTDLRR